MPTIDFSLNGQPRRLEVREGESLLDALRDRCGVTSTKDGCQPQGQCGCCLALVDGQAKTTCALDAQKVAGKQVVTLEGLPEADRALLARAFVATGGLQCGCCIPGFALRATHLCDKRPSPSLA